MKTAIEQGMADAWADFAEFKKQRLDTGKVTAADLFGTREHLKNNYLYRMAAAVLGIYGHSKQEAMYSVLWGRCGRAAADGANRYAMRFAPGQLPPVNAFWSLTMYEMPASLLVANPLNRYLLNSPMLPQFQRDADGGLTLLLQNESPGKDKEANWLPAPRAVHDGLCASTGRRRKRWTVRGPSRRCSGCGSLAGSVMTGRPREPGYRVEDWTWEAKRVRSSVKASDRRPSAQISPAGAAALVNGSKLDSRSPHHVSHHDRNQGQYGPDEYALEHF